MYFNMDYSAFSSGVPLVQSSGFENPQMAAFGAGALADAGVHGGGGIPRDQHYPVWDEYAAGKNAARFDRSGLADAHGVKEFPRRKPRERSPNNVQDLYKTELCNSFTETGSCPYGANCQFAHGMEELRAVTRHPKYKTKMCRNFAEKGSCPYGTRCRFIHGDEDEALLELENDGLPPPGNGAPGGAPSVYFRAPSPEATLPPTFPALNHTIPQQFMGKAAMKGNIYGLGTEVPVSGAVSAPTSKSTSPAPFDMAAVPARAMTPTPKSGSGPRKPAQPTPARPTPARTNEDDKSASADSDAPKRRLAIFQKLSN